MSAISTLVLDVSLGRPGWLVVSLATFDAGCFAAQVANQAGVVAIQPARAGALNAAYLTLYYGAGACGAVAAGILVELAGWDVMMVVAAIAITAAALVNMTSATINVPIESTRTG
nr:hypothetical protein [Paraburkholderia dinghuensis]